MQSLLLDKKKLITKMICSRSCLRLCNGARLIFDIAKLLLELTQDDAMELLEIVEAFYRRGNPVAAFSVVLRLK